MRHHPLARDVDPMTVTYATIERGDVLKSVWQVIGTHTLPSGKVAAVAGRRGVKRTLFVGAPDEPVQVHRRAR